MRGLGQALVGTGTMGGLVERAATIQGTSGADLLVEDIYGGDCASIGLPGHVVASCLGKAKSTAGESADLAKSLLGFFAINTAQLTNLHASMHGCRTALIVGAVDDVGVAECMQRVLHILARGRRPLRAVFFRNARYLSCLGALLRREHLVKQFGSRPRDTATVADGLDDETYTKLRLSPRGTVG